MTPTPQENSSHIEEPLLLPQRTDDNRVVISGMSGLYPQSHNVQEFADILYNKVNPVTQDGLRFKFNHPEVMQYTGSVPELGYFDAQFFKVHFRLALAMDPLSRKILEQSYQAIYDAGVNPEELSGKKVGVYIGTCFSETEKSGVYNATSRYGLAIAGCSKTMFANRISYWLNAKGPSMSIDEACCSSTAALEQAYSAVSRGECEAAIVGGGYLCLHPQSSVHYGRVITLCSDGKTKSFNEQADGCAKSEAISVLFLQKAKDALRVYAEILHVKTEFSSVLGEKTGPKYGFTRNLTCTTNFIKDFYDDVKVPPQAVEYVEAFGSALPEADKVELQAIEEVFCKNRDDSLLIGSVTSNIGYTEAASGLAAITKVLLGYNKGELAANLHCNNPRQDIVALREGRMRVVTENQAFGRTYVAVNGMSVTGVNSHVLLHGHRKVKDLNRCKPSIPHLVTISGRHEEAVKHAFGILKSNPVDPEQLALLHNIHRMNISGHLGRGFIILDTNKEQETDCLRETVDYFDDARRPLWFVYSGMGSQWTGMGTQFMRFPIFAAAIERCHKVLAPKGIDITSIITSTDESTFDNILHSFVGIAAIQIGLTDILHNLGLKPDGIIGHSVGELGCAYADGCLTAEEMILSAYYRGLVSLETKFIRGSMAAIGMGYEEISQICPPEIQVACHNGPESSTLSGPVDVMRGFVAELMAKGIFAREVPCSNIAYHSRYIADAGPGLLKYLKQSITTPKPRSERWLSSSVPESKWNEPIAKFCSAEYLTNNLLSPVLFEETSRLIPSNAVLVEVAPHGLLQAILNRSMPSTCTNVALTKRNHADNALYLLENLGKLYMEGYNFNIQVLYPKIEMPVSPGTASLSHFVKWVHDEKWPLSLYSTADRKSAANCNFVLALQDTEHAYLQGHSMRGNTLYPFAASLNLVWDTYAMIVGMPKKSISVKFSNVHLHTQPLLHDKRQLKLHVSIHRGTGAFEILDGSSKVMTGFIQAAKSNLINYKQNINMHFTSEDIYQLLRDKDYSYSGEFQSIKGTNESLSAAMLVWQDNWVTFIDGLLQLNMLRQPHHAVSQPTYIRRLRINVNQHKKYLIMSNKISDQVLMTAILDEELDYTRCGGVQIQNIQFQNLPPVNGSKIALLLKTLNFDSNCQASYDKKQDLDNYETECQNDFDSTDYVDATELTKSGIIVKVSYAGINSNDIKKANSPASSQQNSEIGFGSDFSGLTESGARVMGIIRSGAASSRVRARPELLWLVPQHWSLEDAATVPLAYAQAFYCLGIKTKLLPGMTVLVHGGAGALGQAVISIALAHDCKVFTTVSNILKKQFLLKLFPALKADHIASSRHHAFADMVRLATDDKGCDVIISCVQGYLKDATLKCTGHFGTCFDISQLQNRDDYDFGMFNLFVLKNYSTVDFSTIFENVEDLRDINKMLTEGIARGYVRPLSRVTFAPRDIASACRLLALSQHRGRVLLRMEDGTVTTQRRLRCSADRSHLLFSNKAIFELRFADRLVARGAKKLCLYVPEPSAYLHHKIRLWRKQGVDVAMFSGELNKQNIITSILNKASQLAPLEGIYVTVGTEVDVINEQHIVELDAASRNLCPELKYFAVLNIRGRSAGKTVCIERIRNKLPATMLMLPVLNEESTNDCAYQRSAVDVMEQALLSSPSILIAQIDRKPRLSLLQEICALAGICVPQDIKKKITLDELGIQKQQLQMICSYLQVEYNVAFTEEQILLLTVDSINQLESSILELPYEDIKGLKTFFNYVDPDELLATTETVIMPTHINSASMRADEFVSDQAYISIVPGMEGHHERFRALCERLKLPALVLQPGFDQPHETHRETAERFAKVLLGKISVKDTFYLLGHESGISVALELASILEDNGLTGTVFCLGCTPEELKYELEDQLSDFTSEKQLQDAVLRHMFTLMAGDDTRELDKALRDIETWPQKVGACVRILLGRVPHSAQYARALIECALARIQQARRNTATVLPLHRPLRSKLVLLRAAHEPPQYAALQQYSHQPLVVHQLSSSLAHIAGDLCVAALINDHLDPQILEDFAHRNLCDTYLLNEGSYTTHDTIDK